MDINWLLRRLKHGDSYTAHNSEGEPYQVNTPPTSISLKAALVIENLSQQLNQAHQVEQNLMRQIHDLNEYNDLLQKSKTPAATSGEDRPADSN